MAKTPNFTTAHWGAVQPAGGTKRPERRAARERVQPQIRHARRQLRARETFTDVAKTFLRCVASSRRRASATANREMLTVKRQRQNTSNDVD